MCLCNFRIQFFQPLQNPLLLTENAEFLVAQRCNLLFNARGFFTVAGKFALGGFQLCNESETSCFTLGNQCICVTDIRCDRGGTHFKLMDLLSDSVAVLQNALGIIGSCRTCFFQAGTLFIQFVDRLRQNREIVTKRFVRDASRRDVLVDLLCVIEPQSHVDSFFLFFNRFAASCLFRLFFKRNQPLFIHGNLDMRSFHIAVSSVELQFRLVLSCTVFGDSSRLFKNVTAFITLLGNHLSDFALSDDGITVSADTGIHKELMNVLAQTRFLIDEILRVTVAETATCHRYLVIRRIQSEFRVCVIKADRYLGVAHLTTCFRAAEYDVFHRSTADISRGNFAEHPTHSVRYVRLAASVRPDDDRRTGFESHHRPVGERLEPMDFQGLKIH